MRILLDMDGVLADFVGGICKAHALPNPYLDPANHGRYCIEEIWGVTPAKFWAPTDEEFWTFLEPTPEADEIVRLCTSAVGKENITVFSSPCATRGCMEGKYEWLRRHFPQFYRQFLFGPQKYLCAQSGHWLIDDFDQNVQQFRSAGGWAWLFPRPWNPLHEYAGSPLSLFPPMLEAFPSCRRTDDAA